MRGNTESARSRRRQAVFSAAVNGGMLLLSAGVVLWARGRWRPDSVLLLALAVLEAAMLIPLALSLRARFKEIEGGEEDEARQY